MTGGTGSGYVIMKGNTPILENKFKLPDYATVFQAEINAILEASKEMMEKVKFKYVKFFIDSQAAILALDSPDITSKIVARTKRALNELANRAEVVTLVWTKAHVGTRGNELADRLAKAVSYTHLTLPTIYSV